MLLLGKDIVTHCENLPHVGVGCPNKFQQGLVKKNDFLKLCGFLVLKWKQMYLVYE